MVTVLCRSDERERERERESDSQIGLHHDKQVWTADFLTPNKKFMINRYRHLSCSHSCRAWQVIMGSRFVLSVRVK
jgi:hypothetical protein